MRFVTTRSLRHAHAAPGQPPGGAPPVSLEHALFDGLAPDGSLYVPEAVDRWSAEEIATLPGRPLADLAARVLRPYTSADIDESTLASIVGEGLNFPIPLVEVEPGVRVLELFHGPTLAFKDVAARVMARLMAALHDGGAPTSVLVATSGDTGSAVAHAFYRVPHMRVIVLYPDGRVSPRQEAQLTMFNGEKATNVRAYAIAGSFDDCQRLVKAANSDEDLLRRVRLTSANSINIGRLLPQMVYYFHAVAQLGPAALAGRTIVSTPSGNFGNLTAGLMAKRAGLPVARFVAATNVNDIVPTYLSTGRFEPRASIPTLANAMDVGNPSNFDRMIWLYDGDWEAMRRDVVGSRHDDGEVRDTIRRVYERRGYLLDPHSAIGYRALKSVLRSGDGNPAIFLATAHPAKFAEVVEPIIGHPIEQPPSIREALARPRHILRLDATLDALRDRLTTND
jgi:threonine synthase